MAKVTATFDVVGETFTDLLRYEADGARGPIQSIRNQETHTTPPGPEHSLPSTSRLARTSFSDIVLFARGTMTAIIAIAEHKGVKPS